jgi:DNA polymerase III sliding clamp (beta) subunit (PCNA family)
MKITVRVNEFKRILEEARFVVPQKTNLPELAHVKVDVNADKTATLCGCDLAKSLLQSFEVVEGDAGTFLLPLKGARDLLQRHVGGTATIEADDQNVVITVGAFTKRLRTKPAKHFPSIEVMPEDRHVISLKFLKRLIAQADTACPKKPFKQCVASVRLDSDGKKLRAIASDNYRIAIAEAHAGDCGEFEFQIPKTAIPLLERREGTKVEVGASATNLFFQTESAVLRFGKPVTKFPPVQKVLGLEKESEFIGTIKVASEALRLAVLRLNGTWDTKTPAVTFEARAGVLRMLTESGSASLEVETGGEPCTFKINPNMVLSCLSQMEGEVTVEYMNAQSLVRLSSGNYRHLIVPLKPEEPAKEAAQKENPSPVTA